MKRLFTIVLVALLAAASSRSMAQIKNHWTSVTDWSAFVQTGAFGTPEAYACYDIDYDGNLEVIVRGDDSGTQNYLVLACDPQLGLREVETVISSEMKDKFGICVDAPVAYTYFDNCDGTEFLHLVKLQDSRIEGSYLLTTTTREGQVSHQYQCVRGGQTVTDFGHEQYEASVPADLGKVLDLTSLQWVKI